MASNRIPRRALPGQWFIFSTLTAAQSAQAQVDAALGFPMASDEVGGGVHTREADGVTPLRTPHYDALQAHPSGTQWALVADVQTTPVLSGQPGIPAPTMLDSTWVGAAPATLARVAVVFGIAAVVVGLIAAAALGLSKPSTAPIDAGPTVGLDAGDVSQ